MPEAVEGSAPIRRTHDAGLPMPGEQITRIYKGHQYVVDVHEDVFGSNRPRRPNEQRRR